ncbi:probable basic-leucine zipper transcription factor H isoform X3 [Periplaneta americana]
MTADDDYKLLQVGIGFTNMVARATKGSADLTRKEIKEGSQILLEKLQKYKPKIAVFNGKLIFEVFSGKKDFSFGRQPDFVDGTNTYMWVMPSSSARCAQLPRAADKVPFYAALKKFRDYLNGIIADLDETEVVFTDSKLKNYFEPELKEEPKEEHAFYAYGRLPTNGELTDLSNAIVKKDEQPPAKKKRGRPKKIKSDCIEVKKVGNEILRKEHDVCGTPKKKRGRPKKIKTDDLMTNSNGLADHTKSSAPIPNCFSPPIQSPINFGQQNLSTSYNNQPLGQSYPQNQSHSPSDAANYHQSPIQSHHYSHSPQPSQPFTHSDLSSEISAAISSEHNLGSPSPTSPSIGPPDFEPPTSMPEETSDGPQNSSRTGKEEIASDNPQNPNECRFSSPTPSNDTSSMTYQNYGSFRQESENHSVIGYSQDSAPEYNSKRNLNQDVSSKSLSGLESLVDQIPSIAEGETQHHGTGNNGSGEEHFDSGHAHPSQFNDDSYLSGYPNGSQYNGSSSSNQNSYSPHFTTSSTNYSVSTSNSYSLHHSSASMNFSVTSLANSSASVNHDVGGQVSSSFSVSSLASNYASMNSNANSYSNLMGASHPMGSHMMGGTNAMFGSSMSGGIMERACGMGSSMSPLTSPVSLTNPMGSMNSLPYPYGQYSHGASSYSSTPAGGFPYTPTHSLHMPSPNYPYPSPYSNSTYPQSSYLPNHMLDRIKQDRMDISFGGF